jgi:hypothetical protein
MRPNDVVPFAMKAIGVEIDLRHFLLDHFATGGVAATVQATGHGEPFCGRRLRDEMDDGLVVSQ